MLPADARGDGHVSRARAAELPAAAADALPHLDQEARRAAAAAGPDPAARVHHEGRVFVRPRRRRDSIESFELPARGVQARSSNAAALAAYDVEAESGMMGGSDSVDFLAPAGAGENTLVTCENGDFAADLEVARGIVRACRSSPRAARRAGGGGDARGEDLRGARGVPLDRRGGDVEGDAGDDRRRNRRARARARRRSHRACEARRGDSAARRARRPTTRSGRPSARPGGSLGPVGFQGEIVADDALRRGPVRRRRKPRRVASARRRGRTRLPGRASPICASLARGRHVPELRRALAVPDGDRGRSHLQARHALLAAARGDVPGRGRPGADRS